MALPAHPLFAYGTILLLQFKVMSGIFRYRDMTAGDDCFWFVTAWHWFHDYKVDIAWSPLYSMFFGSLMHSTTDAAKVMFLNRLLIALMASALVLAVMRRMLPPVAAWIVAAWWAGMPINFDTMYEVHLFAVLPLLVCWLIVLSGQTPWHRGAALGVLLLAALLVRNELILTAASFCLVCALWEIRQVGRALPVARSIGGQCPPYTRRLGRRLVLPYLLPLLLVGGVVAVCYHRAVIKFPELQGYYELKHTVNMGQVYAFGYHQRHPEWNENPWMKYGEICQRDFGTSLPILSLMLRRNPSATAEHVLWNLSLIPNGIQLMLFNGVVGSRDPDYDGSFLKKKYPLPMIAIALVFVIGGVVSFRKDWDLWWREWIKPRAIGWLAMICGIPTALVIMAIERPRPSYLFGLTLLLMTFIGLCGWALVGRIPKLHRLLPLTPIPMILLPLVMPSFYFPHKQGRPLLESYERLRPFEAMFDRTDAAYIGPQANTVQAFVGHGLPACFDYSIFDELPPQMSLPDFLAARHITLFELTGTETVKLQSARAGFVEDFMTSYQRKGWRLLASQPLPDGQWRLFSRR